MDIDSSDIGIVVAHRIGKYSAKPVRPRSIIVKFEDFADRSRVWANRSKLKGSETYVCEDFPTLIEKRRKILWPHYRQAREAASNIRDRCITVDLKADKLIINHQIYTVRDVASIPEVFKGTKYTSSRTTDDVTLFFTKSSPLSNFHQSEFHVNEHAFQLC